MNPQDAGTTLTSAAGLPREGVPGGWCERSVVVAGVGFRLLLPASPDRLLEDLPEGHNPYWGTLWPAAQALAEDVVGRVWSRGEQALELGCGVGLVGLAALHAGLRVTFSDIIPLAVRVAVRNAALNGGAGHARGVAMDWRDPCLGSFPVILAGDVLYQREDQAAILVALDRLMTAEGRCWIAEPDRRVADDFARLATQGGFRVTTRQADRIRIFCLARGAASKP